MNDKTKMLNRLSFSFGFNYLCWNVMKVDRQVYMNKSETMWQILPCHVKLKTQECVRTQKLELQPVLCFSLFFFLFFYPITCQLFEQTISKFFTCPVINMKSHLNVTLHSCCDQIYARHRSEVSTFPVSWSNKSVFWKFKQVMVTTGAPFFLGHFKDWDWSGDYFEQEDNTIGRGGVCRERWGCLLGHLGFHRLCSPLWSSLTNLF